jgi:hypothetical protein
MCLCGVSGETARQAAYIRAPCSALQIEDAGAGFNHATLVEVLTQLCDSLRSLHIRGCRDVLYRAAAYVTVAPPRLKLQHVVLDTQTWDLDGAEFFGSLFGLLDKKREKRFPWPGSTIWLPLK